MAHAAARRESVDTETCRSEAPGKSFVFTKKRGYDVTRSPLLNKVSGGRTHFNIEAFELFVCGN